MPPAAKRNASLILFDVNTSEEFAEAAKKCLLNICGSKWFTESKDCTKLMLLNSEETRNKIDAKFGKCPHVFRATDVINYDPNLIKPHIEDVAKAKGNWLLGLAAAIEEIKDDFLDAKGVMTIQLLFITDLSTPVKEKEKQITFIIDKLNEMNVYLYILGPQVKVPRCMATFEDVRKWAKNVEFVTDEQNNPNLTIAKRIVENTNGIICDLNLGLELFKCYKNRWGLQAWKVPLSIGNTFKSATATTRFLRSLATPKFKADFLDGFKEPWKWHLVDDVNETVPFDNVIGGVFRHGKFIALPQDVEKNFKCEGPRCFSVIGFTDISNVSELYVRGDGSCYVDSDGSKNFKLLVHVLNKENKCIIAKRVYMQNCKPKLVALLPDPQKGILILSDLPYAENFKVNFVEQSLDKAPEMDRSSPAFGAMYEYLQKLDITDSNNNNDESDSVKVPLAASLRDSVRLNMITQRCLHKYLGNEMNLEETKVCLPEFVDTSDYKQYLPPKPVKESKKKRSDDDQDD